MSSGATPQFHTKETPGTATCQFCGVTVGTGYYRIGQKIACAACANNYKQQGPQSSSGAYTRALIFGIGAAFAGMAIYAGFEIATGWMIGYVALLVGWMVGKAMMKGSGGFGGRKYQITAALLTYFAVSMAFIPVVIHYAREHKTNRVTHAAGVPNSTAPHASATVDGDAPQTSEEQPAKAPLSMGAWLLVALRLGLTSPFLSLTSSPGSGLIGLFILFIGIRIAWQTTAGIAMPVVSGPY